VQTLLTRLLPAGHAHVATPPTSVHDEPPGHETSVSQEPAGTTETAGAEARRLSAPVEALSASGGAPPPAQHYHGPLREWVPPHPPAKSSSSSSGSRGQSLPCARSRSPAGGEVRGLVLETLGGGGSLAEDSSGEGVTGEGGWAGGS